MSESIKLEEEDPNVEEEGFSLAKYLIEKIMPNIEHPDPLNCLIATISLVFNRIE